jgi:hypothetical protein
VKLGGVATVKGCRPVLQPVVLTDSQLTGSHASRAGERQVYILTNINQLIGVLLVKPVISVPQHPEPSGFERQVYTTLRNEINHGWRACEP